MQNKHFQLYKTIALFVVVLFAGIICGKSLISYFIFSVPSTDPIPSTIKVVYTTRYSKCGDTVTTTTDINNAQLDSFFASLSDDWHIEQQHDTMINLVKTIDEWCPNHSCYRFIKIYRGRVVVFRGQSADKNFIVQDYNNLKEFLILHKETLEQLRNGILLFDENPEHLEILVKSYLEGITD